MIMTLGTQAGSMQWDDKRETSIARVRRTQAVYDGPAYQRARSSVFTIFPSGFFGRES